MFTMSDDASVTTQAFSAQVPGRQNWRIKINRGQGTSHQKVLPNGCKQGGYYRWTTEVTCVDHPHIVAIIIDDLNNDVGARVDDEVSITVRPVVQVLATISHQFPSANMTGPDFRPGFGRITAQDQPDGPKGPSGWKMP